MPLKARHPSGQENKRRKGPPMRVRHACEECKNRKSKCNGLHPCDQCTRRRYKCTFQQRKVFRKAVPVGYIEYLESQQSLLIQGLRTLYDWTMIKQKPLLLAEITDSEPPSVNGIMMALGVIERDGKPSGCSEEFPNRSRENDEFAVRAKGEDLSESQGLSQFQLSAFPSESGNHELQPTDCHLTGSTMEECIGSFAYFPEFEPFRGCQENFWTNGKTTMFDERTFGGFPELGENTDGYSPDWSSQAKEIENLNRFSSFEQVW